MESWELLMKSRFSLQIWVSCTPFELAVRVKFRFIRFKNSNIFLRHRSIFVFLNFGKWSYQLHVKVIFIFLWNNFWADNKNHSNIFALFCSIDAFLRAISCCRLIYIPTSSSREVVKFENSVGTFEKY